MANKKSKNKRIKDIYCKTCKKMVTPTEKIFDTLICPECGYIIGGKHYAG
jgi:predicted RNA-binding Zn-ribbon protein involved in translation (DUF1610 family)